VQIAKLRAEENLSQTKLAAMADVGEMAWEKSKPAPSLTGTGQVPPRLRLPVSSSVDFSAVADAQNKNEQPIV
jgi:DNA-binding XRE family transcriptional regulator